MVWKRFFLYAVLTVVVIGGLALGGWAIYQMGLSQGYQAGMLAETTTGQATPPMPYYPFHWGYGVPHFPIFMPFLFCFGGFFLLFFLFGALRFGGMHHRGGGPGGWKYSQREWNKEAPPWVKEWHDQLHSRPDEAGGEAESPNNPK